MRAFLTLVTLLLHVIVFIPAQEARATPRTIHQELSSLTQAGVTRTLHLNPSGYSSSTVDRILHEWYHERSFAPLWIDASGPTPRAQEVRSAIESSYDHGLRPNDYFLNQIEKRWKARDTKSQAELDTILTLGTGLLAVDARVGRVAFREVDTESFRGASYTPPDLAALARSVVFHPSPKSAIDEQFPRHSQYVRMKAALAHYRQIERSGGWGTVPAGAPLTRGSQGPRVAALQARLQASEDLPASISPRPNFDDEIVAAVKIFQERHGIPTTGEVHSMTFEALNVPVQKRIDTLIVNLERWRWLNREFSQDKEVFVNIAGYELFGVSDATVALRLPVIVGKAFHATPVFSSELRHIEVTPYWNVPASIAANEILPKLRSNASYLADQKMRLYQNGGSTLTEVSPASIQWSSVSPKQMNRFIIKQDPGPWNALGTLKFVFPNPYSVYLHDTANRELFSQRTRAFSHGCIRVQNPAALAAFLLSTPSDPWDTERVHTVVAQSKNQFIRLPHPVPIHLTYRTAWVERDRSVNFRLDVYKRDATLLLK